MKKMKLESVNVNKARKFAEHISVDIQRVLTSIDQKDRRQYIKQFLVSLERALTRGN